MNILHVDNGCYRMFGNPYQVRVDSEYEINKYIEDNNGINPCFISICQYDPYPLNDKVVFDLDGQYAERDVKLLTNYFEDNDLGSFMVVFTGGGYHFYFKVLEFHYNKEDISRFQLDVEKRLDLKSFDHHVLGDIKRMIRIPGTINEKYGIETEILYEYDSDNFINLYLWKDNNNKHKFYKNIKHNMNMMSTRISELHRYPCIEYYIQMKEPPHIIRVWYVSKLISQGYNEDEIVERLKSFKWIDWNEDITRYQINHNMKNGYTIPKCQTIKNYGYCMEDVFKCRV